MPFRAPPKSCPGVSLTPRSSSRCAAVYIGPSCHPPPSNRWHVDEMVVRIHSREKPRFSTSARYFP
jgi:hypothetical protein